jgi:ankyrin repeat protein
LVNELHANVNEVDLDGHAALWIASRDGNLALVKCLVKELGADIDQADRLGGTPLMAASANKRAEVVIWLVKAGADTQASTSRSIEAGDAKTAANFSLYYGASPEQTAYLEAKTHCSSIGCSGAGVMKCTGCKQARYCEAACQLAHWKAHKADCRRWSAELAAGTENPSE